MLDTSKRNDSHRAEVLETLVEFYLRLNGYFCIRNYLQHRIDGFGLDTESDILAIRLANQEEVLENGHRQQNDETLVLSREGADADCVIAEVKEPSVEFNKRIREPDGRRLITTALKMFGVLPREAFENSGVGEQVVNDLHSQISKAVWSEFPLSRSLEHRVSVRMLVFAPSTAKHTSERKHFDLQHVLDFTKCRMRPGESCVRYRDLSFPSASPWRGCTRLIVETLDESHSRDETELRLEEFIERVLSRWDTQ